MKLCVFDTQYKKIIFSLANGPQQTHDCFGRSRNRVLKKHGAIKKFQEGSSVFCGKACKADGACLLPAVEIGKAKNKPQIAYLQIEAEKMPGRKKKLFYITSTTINTPAWL